MAGPETIISPEIYPVTGPTFSTPQRAGVLNFPLPAKDSTAKLAELLQDNHDSHHIYFNRSRFYNHIPHYLLALYDFGATPSLLSATYSRECTYQRPIPPVHSSVQVDLSDPEKWDQFLGKGEYYGDFVAFFTKEIKERGWKGAVRRWLFGIGVDAGEEGVKKVAEKLCAKIYSGLYHTLIHLGYGIEFEIPAIIAEGLAQTAVTELWEAEFVLEVEKAANQSDPKKRSTKTVIDLAQDIYNNENFRAATHWEDPKKFTSFLERARSEFIPFVSQFRCRLEDLAVKTAEVTNVDALLCTATPRLDKATKFDFFLMHSLTSSLFMHVFVDQDWIPAEAKCRMVEWKAWFDLLVYATRGAPKLYIDEVKNYVPKERTKGNPWLGIVDRAIAYEDNGHGIKVVRALAYGERVSRQYIGKPGFLMEGDMWWKGAAMLVDYLEEKDGPEYIFSSGFDEAWEGIGPKKRY
ncbi:hypothetical protein BDZ91DRAFT_648858 [Kalaharituber pfeilii]|nr:hypothetical protein BDZ91DRAFT_648858 [Kalaharituber pfeilii]